MKASSYKDLFVWKKAHELVLEIYRSTEKFPQSEIFGMTNQMRRASVSITSNIAEGFARHSAKEKVQFYYVSLGSLSELDSQIEIAKDLRYLKNTEYDLIAPMLMETSKMLNALIKSISS
jgi:four helix bundle protein